MASDEIKIKVVPVFLPQRDYFAALAMQAIAANVTSPHCSDELIAQGAVSLADALIAELDKKKESEGF